MSVARTPADILHLWLIGVHRFAAPNVAQTHRAKRASNAAMSAAKNAAATLEIRTSSLRAQKDMKLIGSTLSKTFMCNLPNGVNSKLSLHCLSRFVVNGAANECRTERAQPCLNRAHTHTRAVQYIHPNNWSFYLAHLFQQYLIQLKAFDKFICFYALCLLAFIMHILAV